MMKKYKHYYSTPFILSWFCFQLLFSQEIALSFNTSGYLENNQVAASQRILTTASDDVVPTVKGEMNVSPTGALTYTVPIDVIKGIHNFQPNMSLVYNSDESNGTFGVGWNLSGLSVITQGGKKKAIDGYNQGPQYDENDPFYLDGNRMIQNGNHYILEAFSNVKVFKETENNAYDFKVQHPDGRNAYYKKKIAGFYAIVLLEDALGNPIHYNYVVENNTVYLDLISYGSAQNETQPFEIRFKRKKRNMPVTKWRNAIQYKDESLYHEIIVSSNASGIYKKYRLEHDLTSLGWDRLRKIRIYNGKGDILRPLLFNYNTSQQSATVSKKTKGNTGLYEETRSLGKVATGDFEGTGENHSVYFLRTHTENSSAQSKEYYLWHSQYGNIELPEAMKVYYSANSSSSSSDTSTNSGDREYREAEAAIKEPLELFAGKVAVSDGEIDKKIPEEDLLISVLAKNVNENLSFPNTNTTYTSTEVLFGLTNINQNTNYQYKATIAAPNVVACGTNTNGRTYGTARRVYSGKVVEKYKRKWVQADFNGDGSLDLLVFQSAMEQCDGRTTVKSPVAFLDLALADSEGNVPVTYLNQGNADLFGFPYKSGEDDDSGLVEFYAIEFDGDGTPDVLMLDKKNKKFHIYKLSLSDYSFAKVLTKTLVDFEEDTPLIFGDYNGDGLTDFIMPKKVYDIEELNAFSLYGKIVYDQQIWTQYIATGKNYRITKRDFTKQGLSYCKPSQRNIIDRSSDWEKFWSGKSDKYKYTEYASCAVIPMDFNHDGRTDLISFKKLGEIKYKDLLSESEVNHSYITDEKANGISFINNVYDEAKGFSFAKNKATISLTYEKVSPLSLFITSQENLRLNQTSTSIKIHDPLLKKDIDLKIQSDTFLENHIQEVDNHSGVTQKIEYAPLNTYLESGRHNYFYQAHQSPDLNYMYKRLGKEYYIHTRIPNKYLVGRITTLFNDQSLTKEYRYENAVQHLDGLGFLGFMRTHASDAYESEEDNGQYYPKDMRQPVLWTINTYRPDWENRLVRTTYGGTDEESFLKKTSVTYEKITSKTSAKLHPKQKHYVLKLEMSHDALTTVRKYKDYAYNDDLLLARVRTNHHNQGTTETRMTYQPKWNHDGHYFYGRIKETQQIQTVDGATFTTKDEIAYNTNGLSKQTKTYGHNTQPVTTDYTYDAYGNVVKQTVSAEGLEPQTTQLAYDTTHRFVVATTSPEGLTATRTLLNDLGWVKKETSALGLSTTYEYDNWGNAVKVTDYLGNITLQQKKYTGDGGYWVSNVTEGRPKSITYYDLFDRVVRVRSQSLNGKWAVTDTEYDVYGRAVRKSEPYFEGTTPTLWNTTEYDALSRPITKTDYTGKTAAICYEGLTVTVDDGYQKTAKTLNAFGQTVHHQDSGGEITYQYHPNGTLKTADYDGIKITVEQDGWGNKTQLSDPSAGVYRYEYDALGRLTKEITPKGETQTVYDAYGKPLYEITNGEGTNRSMQYTYDPETQLLTKVSGYSDDLPFTYETQYDAYYRIKGKKETHPAFTYETQNVYDAYGRVEEQSLSATLAENGTMLKNTLKNHYNTNGILYKVEDAATKQAVWTVKNVNAKGQTLLSEYGNGYRLMNSYDRYTPKTILHQHQETQQTAVDLEYRFNVAQGVLQKRKVNHFVGIEEDFVHDALKRLTEEKIDGQTVNEYAYDPRGRMTYNTEIGKYQYPEGRYHIDRLHLNNRGEALKNTRGFHTIRYNSYKKATEIHLEGRGRISYAYNLFQGRAVAYYGSEEEDPYKRPLRKYYSADHAIEITHNRTENTVKMVQYVDGDPYTASYVKIAFVGADAAGTTTNGEAYYLHRDYQASIIAITDSEGQLVEQRYYNAWGKRMQYQSNYPQHTTHNPLLDRGYTGHEHLSSVGLVHMNGRLYDPSVRRFLGPDNFIQDPYNTQNFNRYSYVLNSPLVYTDPSGESILGAIIIGIAVGVTSNAVLNLMNDVPWWHGAGKSAVIGGVSGGLSFGIGEIATHWTNQALMHAATGGAMSAIDGESFITGFASGAFASMLSSGLGGISFKSADLRNAVIIASGGLSGGVGSVIAGGNFWKGVRQGLITAGLNHMMHATYNAIQKKYDLTILLDAEGAANAGHSAVAIESEEGQYRYVSKDGVVDADGDNVRDNKGVYGEADVAGSPRGINYSSLEALLVDFPKYEQSLTFKVSLKQANRAYNAALRAANSNYYLVGSSCIDVPTAALKAAYRWYTPVNYALDKMAIPMVPMDTVMDPVPNYRFFRTYLINYGVFTPEYRYHP